MVGSYGSHLYGGSYANSNSIVHDVKEHMVINDEPYHKVAQITPLVAKVHVDSVADGGSVSDFSYDRSSNSITSLVCEHYRNNGVNCSILNINDLNFSERY